MPAESIAGCVRSVSPSTDSGPPWQRAHRSYPRTLEASAKVSFRLVGNQNPERIREAFRAYVRSKVPADCSVEFHAHGGSPAIHLPYESPLLNTAKVALSDEWPKPAVIIGMGGSIPIVGDFQKMLGMESLLVGFGLSDDRIHSPNEKYELQSYHKGIRSWIRILDALAA